MALKLAPVGTIQMVNEDGVYTIKGNNKKMLDGDGCLYTDSYCFHGTYVFKYNTDILLGNFYYAPSNTAADGSKPTGRITFENTSGLMVSSLPVTNGDAIIAHQYIQGIPFADVLLDYHKIGELYA